MIQEITTIISTVGFPIACCIVMFLQNDKLQKTLGEISNTMILLNERIGKIEEKIEDNEEVK